MMRSIFLAVASTFLAGTLHAAPVVLFDQGHGQRFVIENDGALDLSKMAATFRDHGFQVMARAEPLDVEALAGVDALVLSGPFRAYSRPEINAVLDFLSRGGRLAMMLHIAPPADNLLALLGVAYSNGVIREKEQVIGPDALNFRVTRLQSHPVLTGIDHFSLYGGWALTNTTETAAVVARTSPDAWVDLDGSGTLTRGDAVGSFGVAVVGTYGNGSFIVFGDDGIFQNEFLDADNAVLAGNLAAWLKARN